MNITKGQLLTLLNSIDSDPQLLAKIVIDTMKRLPDSYRWQLAQQLYMDYYWTGPCISVTNNITKVSRKFASVADIKNYLEALGYKCTTAGIRDAINGHSSHYCNHTFKAEQEKEITYL